MARIAVTTHVEAPPSRVFAVLTAWEAHPSWRRGVRSVRLRSEQREGVGTALRCRTEVVAGIAIDDDLVVTAWQPERVVAVRHTARLVRGVGAIELTPTRHGTRVDWWEELDLPLWAVGEAIGTLLVVPWLSRRHRASLAGLKRVCESDSVRP
ncbi:MAG TPA: SRPBCC family protein [Egibacteraceae bacterium]